MGNTTIEKAVEKALNKSIHSAARYEFDTLKEELRELKEMLAYKLHLPN